MRVRALHLEQFRLYENVDLQFSPGINLFYGSNGQGKTSLLEAIFLCTCARSHRTARDQELIRHHQNHYTVELFLSDQEKICDQQDMESIRILFTQADAVPGGKGRSQRLVWHNGVQLDRIAEMMGLFHAVMFAPEDIMLVKGNPQGRRRFLDLLLSQLKRPYFLLLQKYVQTLNQRNRLLKQIRECCSMRTGDRLLRGDLQDQLDLWTDAFLSVAAAITMIRKSCVESLNTEAAISHALISGDRERLRIRYTSSKNVEEAATEEECREAYQERYSKVRDEEISRGSSLLGPHRDDLDIQLNDLPLKIYGSQGQQRTAVLALKHAELRYIHQQSGSKPALLLDDVLPELDEGRRLALLSAIDDAQVFLTCTDVESVHEKLRSLLHTRESAVYEVSASTVRQTERKIV